VLSELELSVLELDEDDVDGVLAVAVDPVAGVVVLVSLDDVEVVDEVEPVDGSDCASAVLATPETRPMVRAPAATAAALPTMVARVRSARAFM
jgi:hypothetical protein